jgi:phospholipase C
MWQVGLLSGTLILAGCSASSPFHAASTAGATTDKASFPVQGRVHGGQFPVTGSTVQLYAAGAGSYGAGAQALLTLPVITDANGNFNIPAGAYTCPSASTETYIVSTGGDPGLGSDNPAISLMAALGPCGSLGSIPYVVINEATTVASVWALAPFMNYGAEVGTIPTNTLGLTTAFSNVNNLVDITQGSAPGPVTLSGVTIPVAEINTLADILASCINSTGTAACNALFAAATPPGGSAPTNTLDAALDMALNPANNVVALFNLPTPAAPFSPVLTSQPINWSLGNCIVTNPVSSIASLSPASGTLGQTVPVTITDLYTNFVQGSTTASFPAGSGITVSNFTVTSPTTATATLSISASATVQTDTMTVATGAQTATGPFSVGVVTQAASNSYGATAAQYHSVSSMTALTAAQKLALLQANIKYVFVIFQENRSFDHYFGTFPGANGLFATYPNANPADPSALPANDPSFASSFSSAIQNVTSNGTVSYTTQSPFLVPRQIVNQSGATTTIYSEDMYSVDHSHTGYVADLHSDQATRSIPQNDGYPLDQEGLYYNTDASGTSAPIYSTSTHAAPTSQVNLQTKQKGEIVMGHVDCDTIPFMWQYADRFTLFDNMHQTAIGPSTPNAIAMIGSQTGDTQWVLHPNNYDSYSITYGSGSAVAHIQYSLPNLTDTPPFAGSASDNAAVKPPYGPDESSGQGPTTIGTPKAGQETLTFASLPLSFMGSEINSITASDQHSAFDLADVQQDMAIIGANNPNVPWGWYQQGYGIETFDNTAFGDDEAIYTTAPEHASYIVHHNGPQYFGYLGDNTQEQGNMHGLSQFYNDVTGALTPGVYYIRGGYYNNLSQTPLDPNATVRQDFTGNDDHGSYSDSQISESMVAQTVNAIASSPYWSQSAIIITYDESDGFFDHQPEQFRSWGPDGQPETGGPRIPLIVVSPFAVTHGVSHVYSEHSAVIRFVEELKGLVPLGQLPDEAAALATGATLCANPPAYGSTPAPTLVKPGAQSTSTTINPFCKPNGTAQTALGPGDVFPGMGDLTEAFDNDRLLGNIAPLPETYATISSPSTLPHYSAIGACSNQALSIVPTDYKNGVYSSTPFDPTQLSAVPVVDPPPADFNPRPTVSVGSPYYNTGNNTTANSPNGTGGPWPQ